MIYQYIRFDNNSYIDLIQWLYSYIISYMFYNDLYNDLECDFLQWIIRMIYNDL
jgi:hypothetical protein